MKTPTALLALCLIPPLCISCSSDKGKNSPSDEDDDGNSGGASTGQSEDTAAREPAVYTITFGPRFALSTTYPEHCVEWPDEDPADGVFNASLAVRVGPPDYSGDSSPDHPALGDPLTFEEFREIETPLNTIPGFIVGEIEPMSHTFGPDEKLCVYVEGGAVGRNHHQVPIVRPDGPAMSCQTVGGSIFDNDGESPERFWEFNIQEFSSADPLCYMTVTLSAEINCAEGTDCGAFDNQEANDGAGPRATLEQTESVVDTLADTLAAAFEAWFDAPDGPIESLTEALSGASLLASYDCPAGGSADIIGRFLWPSEMPGPPVGLEVTFDTHECALIDPGVFRVDGPLSLVFTIASEGTRMSLLMRLEGDNRFDIAGLPASCQTDLRSMLLIADGRASISGGVLGSVCGYPVLYVQEVGGKMATAVGNTLGTGSEDLQSEVGW